jgi:hypothetical protein
MDALHGCGERPEGGLFYPTHGRGPGVDVTEAWCTIRCVYITASIVGCRG